MANQRICEFPDCGNAAHARNWCQKHYKRWMAHGDPSGCGKVITPTDADFDTAIRDYLTYEPDSGAFRWLKKSGYNSKIDAPAGNLDPSGYVRISFRGRAMYAHRLAMFFTNGCWPRKCVDHIDGNRGNNRISNLREVGHAANIQNVRRPAKNNTSGFLGVTKVRGKWLAQIRVNGRNHYLGRHETAEAAHEAYVRAKRRLHDGCTI